MAVLLDTSVAMEIMMAKIKLVTQGSPLAMPARASPSQSDSPESCKNKKKTVSKICSASVPYNCILNLKIYMYIKVALL